MVCPASVTGNHFVIFAIPKKNLVGLFHVRYPLPCCSPGPISNSTQFLIFSANEQKKTEQEFEL